MKIMMKKFFTAISAIALLASCDGGDTMGPGNTLTPEENKARLEQCAMNVLGKINPQDHQVLIETIESFTNKADYGLSLKDQFSLKSKMSAVDVICKAVTSYNPVLLSELATDRDYLSIPSGIYTFDESLQQWNKTPSEDLQFIFDANGAEASISVRWSGQEFSLQPDNSKEIVVPEHIEMLINRGNASLATLTVNTAAVDIETIKLDCEVSLQTIGDYSWLADVNLTASGATATASMDKSSSNIVSTVAGLQLEPSLVHANMDEDDLEKAVLSGTTTTVINSELMLIGNLSKAQEMLGRINNINASSERDHYIEEASIINQYVDAYLMYAGEGSAFASIETQAYLSYEYNYGDIHIENYDIEPVIVFASDASRYSFDEYFNEADFANFVQNFRALYDQYEAMID